MELKAELEAALGPGFSVERELEGGGMSRVFLARDLALKRDIVAKVLRPELLTGGSVERFEREITMVAALQHPHIVPLLGTGHLDVPGARLPFYTMPFIRGDSLRTHLGRSGELSVNETVHILRDIARALEYAHAEGVVHRDIKPENVMLSGGVAVVMDFGVAKAVKLAAATGSPGPSLTSSGVALGTPAYMSPEQATADPQIDQRTDVYSFGCIAYEMLTGTTPFGNRTPAQILALHVTETPEPITRRRPKLPSPLSVLVMRCLEKRPSDRPQSAAELITALDAVSTPSGGMEPTSARVPAVRSPRKLLLGAGILVLAVAGTGAVLWARAFRPLSVTVTRTLIATGDVEQNPDISPDGALVAYIVTPDTGGPARLVVRQVGGGGELTLASPVAGRQAPPTWSPDGATVLFNSEPGGRRAQTLVVPYVGGTPRPITEPGRPFSWPRWHPDGKRIVFARDRRLWIQDLETGTATALSSDSGAVQSPAVSPDGRRVAFIRGGPVRRFAGRGIWTVAIEGGPEVRFTDSTAGSWNPVWAPDGKSLLFLSDVSGVADLYQQRISAEGKPIGAAVRITTGLDAETFSLDRSGQRAVYGRFRQIAPLYSAEIPERGEASITELRQVTRELQSVQYPDASPDGRWVAFDSDLRGISHIFKVSTDGGESIQLTADSSSDFVARWSPDGGTLAYHRAGRETQRSIRTVGADGRDDRAVTALPVKGVQPTWSPSGDSLGFGYGGVGGPLALVSRNPDGSWSAPTVIPGSDGVSLPRWSPDGKWIAYTSRGSILLLPPAGGVPRALVRSGDLGGPAISAVWSADGSTVFVSAQDSTLTTIWAIPVSGGPPRRLLSTRRGQAGSIFATDGRRLFISFSRTEADLGLIELRH